MLLAERIGALLGTTLPTKGWFDGHAWDVGVVGALCSAVAQAIIVDADLVIGIGAELGQYTTEGGRLFPDAKTLRIDVEQAALADLPDGFLLRGDARETLRALGEVLAVREPRTGFRTAAVRHRLAQEPAAHDGIPPESGIDPRLMMSELGPLLPRGARVFCGVGHFWSFPVQYMPLRSDVEINFVYEFNSIGQTLPTAIGAAVADRSRPVVVLEGDGSLMMHVQELDTAARFGLDVIIVVINDGGFGAEMHKLSARGNPSRLATYQSPDFAAVATGLGGSGRRIDDLGQLGEALRAIAGQRRPAVLDVRVSPHVVSDPYRRLHFGLDNRAPRLSSADARL
jgi:acetolactate synthase-1/2/3 large subunit